MSYICIICYGVVLAQKYVGVFDSIHEAMTFVILGDVVVSLISLTLKQRVLSSSPTNDALVSMSKTVTPHYSVLVAFRNAFDRGFII